MRLGPTSSRTDDGAARGARAAERGEVRLDMVTPRIASLPGDLLRHELLITDAPVSDAFIAEIVDEIFLPLVTVHES